MEVMEAIANRRSVRQFKSDPVPDSVLETLVEAARWAPSADNAQPWTFVVVREQGTKEAIAETCFKQGQTVVQAPVVIVCCGDMRRWKLAVKGFEIMNKRKMGMVGMSQEDAGQFFQYLIDRIRARDEKELIAETETNVAIAVENMLLAATGQELGTCWMANFDPARVREALRIPEHVIPFFLVLVGYPAKEEAGERQRLPLHKIVRYEKY
jgi:nitroreductase